MADFDTLLLRTSRTFALSIPLLPEPTRREVTLAYLLFRIADTLEDAVHWRREQRLAALSAFERALRDSDVSRAQVLAEEWVANRPCDHDGYLDLLRELPQILAAVSNLDAQARDAIIGHTLRTAEGMARFVARGDEDGRLQLIDLDDLRAYCYAVAGIVGEMLTALFLMRPGPHQRAAAVLERTAATFGEGLQLVNILKDADADARHGRVYLPAEVPRRLVFELARADLDAADAYVRALHDAGADRGLLAFTTLPVMLARPTLDRVELAGPGAKLTRAEVASLVERLERTLGIAMDLPGTPRQAQD